MAEEHGMIILQVLTEGYLEMTYSWICNVRGLGKILHKTLFVATDVPAYRGLAAFGDDVNVVLKPFDMPAKMSYGQPKYWEYMLFRAELLMQLFHQGITVFLTESDAIWLSDPLPTVLGTEGDIISANDFMPGGAPRLQGGFLLFRPTDATQR
jgi:hypothetical protein